MTYADINQLDLMDQFHDELWIPNITWSLVLLPKFLSDRVSTHYIGIKREANVKII